MKSQDKIPNHIAIIPDGNRRWARGRGKKPWEGHEFGAQNIEKIVRRANELGIKHMSFWGSSIDNLTKRPFQEKRALLNIYRKYFSRLTESEDIHKNQARISVIGKWEEQFPEALKKVIKRCIEKTKNYQNHFLNFLLAYNGDDDMIQAVSNIVKKCDRVRQVTAETIKDNLMTRDLPPVDLLIRTGGEPHNSVGFLMWQTANSQMYFTEKLFPDFDDQEFEKAVKEYQRRERRLGK
jgi:tritrans,polycis-undecaprenyl-diphosphate synthase [geranylgeranyl-diphosphate specific]